MNKFKKVTVGPLAVHEGFADLAKLPQSTKQKLDDSLEILSSSMKSACSTYDGYIAWRKAWRRLYSQVSDVIHNLKDYRDGHIEKVGDNVWETIRPLRQSDVEAIKMKARWMMDLRLFSKWLSNMSREEAKAKRQAKAQAA